MCWVHLTSHPSFSPSLSLLTLRITSAGYSFNWRGPGGSIYTVYPPISTQGFSIGGSGPKSWSLAFATVFLNVVFNLFRLLHYHRDEQSFHLIYVFTDSKMFGAEDYQHSTTSCITDSRSAVCGPPWEVEVHWSGEFICTSVFLHIPQSKICFLEKSFLN